MPRASSLVCCGNLAISGKFWPNLTRRILIAAGADGEPQTIRPVRRDRTLQFRSANIDGLDRELTTRNRKVCVWN